MPATATNTKKTAVKSSPKSKVNDAEFMTPSEFARHFRISRSKVQTMIKTNAVRTIPMPTADPDAKKQLRRIPMAEVRRIEAGK